MSIKLFRKFDTNGKQKLSGIELIKFQKYIDRLFDSPKLKHLKPPSIFNSVSMKSSGVEYLEFKKWIIENLTYDDTPEELSGNSRRNSVTTIHQLSVKEISAKDEVDAAENKTSHSELVFKS